jgi:hypothetical protein
MQGYWSVIALWQQSLGFPTPGKIDTGVKFITQEMAKDYTGLSGVEGRTTVAWPWCGALAEKKPI